MLLKGTHLRSEHMEIYLCNSDLSGTERVIRSNAILYLIYLLASLKTFTVRIFFSAAILYTFLSQQAVIMKNSSLLPIFDSVEKIFLSSNNLKFEDSNPGTQNCGKLTGFKPRSLPNTSYITATNLKCQSSEQWRHEMSPNK